MPTCQCPNTHLVPTVLPGNPPLPLIPLNTRAQDLVVLPPTPLELVPSAPPAIAPFLQQIVDGAELALTMGVRQVNQVRHCMYGTAHTAASGSNCAMPSCQQAVSANPLSLPAHASARPCPACTSIHSTLQPTAANVVTLHGRRSYLPKIKKYTV